MGKTLFKQVQNVLINLQLIGYSSTLPYAISNTNDLIHYALVEIIKNKKSSDAPISFDSSPPPSFNTKLCKQMISNLL